MSVIFKCKMCGGDLTLQPGSTVAECTFCGSVQTVPAADNDKKLLLFERAERLRRNCEFDKAAGIYEALVADFPEEAEAYWGLVLCKYGIEYVDDPGTGKKIPTCHRTSFDSVLDDIDFEQAVDCADSASRRVYLDQAGDMELLRKRIIAVSAEEDPYDVFICYKEKDAAGNRTMDSHKANQLYDALTQAGYRVFYARITLEDHLGKEYEPYIFAALHSAPVMLVVGSCYAHFNAVWVRNEWSRFLQLREKNKNKQIFTCFTSKVDPNVDIPKPLQPLQGKNMDEIGSVQDVVRNIRKIIQPKQTVKETVIVQSNDAGRIRSVLDRGQMALEDGEWKKADGFFEEVLNLDSKNARAYLGKALAAEEFPTLKAWAKARADALENCNQTTVRAEPDEEKIRQMVEEYTVPGWLGEEEIRTACRFARTFTATAEARNQQLEEEKAHWRTHRLVSRAFQFADNREKAEFQAALDESLGILQRRLADAEAKDAAADEELRSAYENHLREVEERLRRRAKTSRQERDETYRQIAEAMKTEITEPKRLEQFAAQLNRMKGYRDSKELEKQCFDRCRKLQWEEARRKNELEDALREEAMKAIAAELRKRRIITAVTFLVVVAIAACALWYWFIFRPQQQIDKANDLLESGNVEDAMDILNSVDADASGAMYALAESFLDAGNPAAAACYFGKAGSYKDAGERAAELWKQIQEDSYKPIVMDYYGYIALKEDGTVYAKGTSGNAFSGTENWTDVILVDYDHYGEHVVGLRSDGTVVTGCMDDRFCKGEDCDTSSWKNIVDVAVDAFGIYGLKSDGTLVHTKVDKFDAEEIDTWEDVVDIEASEHILVGRKADGTIIVRGDKLENFNQLKNVVEIDVDYNTFLAVTGNGMLYSTLSEDARFALDTKNHDYLGSGYEMFFGLLEDGTVAWTGNPDASWVEAICAEVETWTDIVAMSCMEDTVVGIRADGTAVVAGSTHRDEILSWTGLRVPD